MSVYPARVMQAGENYGGDIFMEGVSIYEQGCVNQVDIRFGSVEGKTDANMDERRVWVGLQGGFLMSECDDCILPPWGNFGFIDDEEEEEEPEDKLCKHGVAVALEALDRGARFYEFPDMGKFARPKAHPNAEESVKTERGSLLNGLRNKEFAPLLQRLLEAKPELIADLEVMAVDHLNDVNKGEVCFRAKSELARFRPAELPAFIDAAEGEVTARYPGEDEVSIFGDVVEDVMLSYSLRPLVEDMNRRFAVGASYGAGVVALGVIQALYEARKDEVWADPMVLDYLGEGVPWGEAQRIVALASSWGRELARADLRTAAPEWADRLARLML